MLKYNSLSKKVKKYNNLIVEEVSPIMKLNIRGKSKDLLTNGDFNKGSSFFAIVEKISDMILPTEANTSASSEKLTSLWLGPDEWMIVNNDKHGKNTNIFEI